ncbi:hypothetical protein PG987_005400 [Apiospora arundinis]
MASGAVTLPSIQDPRGYPAQGGQGWDPRASGSYGTSPNSSNGYPAESSSGHQGSYSPAGSSGYAPPHGYLPPVQPSPQDARGSYPRIREGRNTTRQRAQHLMVQMRPMTLHTGQNEDHQDSTHLTTAELGNR